MKPFLLPLTVIFAGLAVFVLKRQMQLSATRTTAISQNELPFVESEAPSSSLSTLAPERIPVTSPNVWEDAGTARHTGYQKEWVTTFVPAKDWKNVGKQTPAAAFETYLWAATNGDFDRLAEVIEIGDWIRGAFVRNLSDEERAKFGAPDRIASLIIAAQAKDIVAVPSVSFVSESGHVFRAALTLADGREMVGVFRVRQLSDGFRIQVAPDVIESFFAGDRKASSIPKKSAKQ